MYSWVIESTQSRRSWHACSIIVKAPYVIDTENSNVFMFGSTLSAKQRGILNTLFMDISNNNFHRNWISSDLEITTNKTLLHLFIYLFIASSPSIAFLADNDITIRIILMCLWHSAIFRDLLKGKSIFL